MNEEFREIALLSMSSTRPSRVSSVNNVLLVTKLIARRQFLGLFTMLFSDSRLQEFLNIVLDLKLKVVIIRLNI